MIMANNVLKNLHQNYFEKKDVEKQIGALRMYNLRIS